MFGREPLTGAEFAVKEIPKIAAIVKVDLKSVFKVFRRRDMSVYQSVKLELKRAAYSKSRGAHLL